jgi:hypothetical protein
MIMPRLRLFLGTPSARRWSLKVGKVVGKALCKIRSVSATEDKIEVQFGDDDCGGAGPTTVTTTLSNLNLHVQPVYKKAKTEGEVEVHFAAKGEEPLKLVYG